MLIMIWEKKMSKSQYEEWKKPEFEDVEFLDELYYGDGDGWFDDDDEFYEDDDEFLND